MGKKAREQHRLERRLSRLLGRLMREITARPPRDTAQMIMVYTKGERVPPFLPELLWLHSPPEYVRAIGNALIDLDPRGVTALTFNAAIATTPEESEELLIMALARGGGAEIEEDLAITRAAIMQAMTSCDQMVRSACDGELDRSRRRGSSR